MLILIGQEESRRNMTLWERVFLHKMHDENSILIHPEIAKRRAFEVLQLHIFEANISELTWTKADIVFKTVQVSILTIDKSNI